MNECNYHCPNRGSCNVTCGNIAFSNRPTLPPQPIQTLKPIQPIRPGPDPSRCNNLTSNTINYIGPETKYTYCMNECNYHCPNRGSCNFTCGNIVYSNRPTLPPVEPVSSNNIDNVIKTCSEYAVPKQRNCKTQIVSCCSGSKDISKDYNAMIKCNNYSDAYCSGKYKSIDMSSGIL
jgi:hypothetical protein